MSTQMYNELHYDAFLSKLTKQQTSVLSIVTENPYISKTDIIEKMKFEHSKNPTVAAIDSLYFAGLISFRYKDKQHQYFLTDDGIAFTQYVDKKLSEELKHGAL